MEIQLRRTRRSKRQTEADDQRIGQVGLVPELGLIKGVFGDVAEGLTGGGVGDLEGSAKGDFGKQGRGGLLSTRRSWAGVTDKRRGRDRLEGRKLGDCR